MFTSIPKSWFRCPNVTIQFKPSLDAIWGKPIRFNPSEAVIYSIRIIIAEIGAGIAFAMPRNVS